MLTELNQLVTNTGGGRVIDLGCRRSLNLGWVDRRSFGPQETNLVNIFKLVKEG